MKNWKVMILVVFALIWLVDEKPWRDGSESAGQEVVYNRGDSDSSGGERPYTCPRCEGSGVCWRCKGSGTYYSKITGETKACALCKKQPGDCGTCDGYGTLKDSTYREVMANEEKRAANSPAGGSTGTTAEEAVLCMACSTTGRCRICDGNGVYRSNYDLSKEFICSACNHGVPEDVGKCQICGGDGITNN